MKKTLVKLLSCIVAVSLVGVPMLISRALPALKGITATYEPGGTEKYCVPTGTTISEADFKVLPKYRDGTTGTALTTDQFTLSVPDGTAIASGENHFTITYNGKAADIYLTGFSDNQVGTRIVAGIPAYVVDVTVVYKTPDGDTVSTDTSRTGDNALLVRAGEEFTIPASVPSGYTLNPASETPYHSGAITNDADRTVTFIVDLPATVTHTVTIMTTYLDANGNVERVVNSERIVNHGQQYTFTAPNTDGYFVIGDTQQTITAMDDATIAFYLQKEPDPAPPAPGPTPPAVEEFVVTYTDGGIGVFTDESYVVEKGSVTPAFKGNTDREGYIFIGWSPAVSDTVTGDVTYTAVYKIDDQQYTITVIILLKDEEGNIIGQTSKDYTYRKGEDVVIYAPEVEGYDVVGKNSEEFTVTKDETVTFTYKKMSAPPEPIVDPDPPLPDPVEPVQPDPVRPDPVVPTPTQPTEPTNPTEPTEPSEPSEPSEPARDVEPEEPDDPVQPKEPTKPEEPKQPEQPVKPEEPIKPEEPKQPEEPTKPQESSKPDTPDTPDNTKPDNTPDNPMNDPVVRRNVTTALIGGGVAVTLVATGTLSHLWLLFLLLFFKKRRIKFHSILSDEENKFIETDVPAGSDPRLLQSIINEFKTPEKIYEGAVATGCMTYLPPNTKMAITILGETSKYKADENKMYSLLSEYKGDVYVNIYQKAAKIDITLKFTL